MPDSTYGRMAAAISGRRKGISGRRKGIGAAETEGLVSRVADRSEHSLGGKEVRARRQRGRFVGRRRGGEPGDVRHGHPVVPVARVHVAHAGPDGDLGACADAGVLLEIRGAGDFKVHAEQVGVERGAAGDGGLHSLATADLGAEHGPADRSRRQGTNDAETAVAGAGELAELTQLLSRPGLAEQWREILAKEVCALAVTRMRSERSGVEMQVVGPSSRGRCRVLRARRISRRGCGGGGSCSARRRDGRRPERGRGRPRRQRCRAT